MTGYEKDTLNSDFRTVHLADTKTGIFEYHYHDFDKIPHLHRGPM